MPRRKNDATPDDVAAPETPGGGEENGREIQAAADAAGDDGLPPPGAESEPAPQAVPTEPVEAVTVDAGPPETIPAPAPEPPAEERRFAEEHHEEAGEEEAGWSLPARVLTALVLLLAGAGLGLWAAPKLAPMLPSGMKPVADWLTPGSGAAEAEAEIAALRTDLDQGLGGVEARFADLPSGTDVDQRIGAAVGAAQGALAGEIATLKETVGQIDLTATRQQLDRLDAAMKGQAAELGDLKEQLAGTAAARGQLNEEAVQKLDVYSAEVQGLRAEMGTLQDNVSALAARIDEVAANADREIATAQTRVGEIQTQAATALGAAETDAAVALVRAAVASGQPFADAARAAHRTAGDHGARGADRGGGERRADARQAARQLPRRGARGDPRQHHGQRRRRGRRPLARLSQGAGRQPVADAAAGHERPTPSCRAWRTACGGTTSRARWPRRRSFRPRRRRRWGAGSPARGSASGPSRGWPRSQSTLPAGN